MPAPVPSPVSPPAPEAFRLWRATALIAGVFTLVVFAAMVARHELGRSQDPWKSPRLAELKQRLQAEPKNEALKEEIRALDLRLRTRYFHLLGFKDTGAWLLLGGAMLAVLAGRRAARLRERLPSPRRSLEAAEIAAREAALARWVALATGVLAAGSLVAMGLTSRTVLPTKPAALDKLIAKLTGTDATTAADLPTDAEFAAQWPRFLGPAGASFTTNASFPLQFDLARGEGVRWKAPVPAPGFNSPLVWGGRVFLSGGDATARSVFAFDAATGRQLWQRAVTNPPAPSAKPLEIPESTGYAAATMATDGRRVYAIFANGDLAAFTLEGAPVWSKNLGAPHNQYGHATSLATWQGRLIVQFDQGEPEDNLSKLFAFDGATGRIVWQKTRPVGQSWASPLVYAAAGKPQIATLAGDWVIAYAATDGAELWRAKLLSGEITPSPAFGGGWVIAASPSDRLFALRPDGAGDVTKTHVAWETEENVPDVTSPACNGDLVITATSSGMVTCFDLRDGKKLWEHELGFDVSASPAIAGDRVYVFGTKGKAAVLAAARTFQSLASLTLGEGVFASPAFAGGAMFVRTEKTLFCVGAPAASAAEVQARRP